MIAALGYSNDLFEPANPGRLCRGRERWIESFPLTEPVSMHRMVISGARFSDDSAADALRGLPMSGLTVGAVLRTVFPKAVLVAVAEDGSPNAVPDAAVGVEHYRIRRPGGPLRVWGSRWLMACESADDIDLALRRGASSVLALEQTKTDPPSWLVEAADAVARTVELEEAPPSPIPDPLRQALFLLSGHRQEGLPARNFQPAALPDVLQHCRAVALVHQDKHDVCLGIYSTAGIEREHALSELSFDNGALPVPFAIPPMLARWDRALWELRQDWDESRRGEFPVPPSKGPSPSWARGSRGEE